MKIIRLSTLSALTLAVGSGALLFWVSQHVQHKEKELTILKQAIFREEESIRVLKAEWDYLNQPERLEVLAKEYLDLQAPKIEQIKKEGEELPKPFYPVLPQTKPTLQPQPASLSAHSLPLKAIPPRKIEKEHFKTLLDNKLEEDGK